MCSSLIHDVRPLLRGFSFRKIVRLTIQDRASGFALNLAGGTTVQDRLVAVNADDRPKLVRVVRVDLPWLNRCMFQSAIRSRTSRRLVPSLMSLAKADVCPLQIARRRCSRSPNA
jgi:hypothetical protein